MTLRDSSSMSSPLCVLDSIYFYLVRIYIVYMVNVVPSIFSIVCSVNFFYKIIMHLPCPFIPPPIECIVLIMDNDAVAHGMYLLTTPLFLRKKKLITTCILLGFLGEVLILFTCYGMLNLRTRSFSSLSRLLFNEL